MAQRPRASLFAADTGRLTAARARPPSTPTCTRCTRLCATSSSGRPRCDALTIARLPAHHTARCMHAADRAVRAVDRHGCHVPPGRLAQSQERAARRRRAAVTLHGALCLLSKTTCSPHWCGCVHAWLPAEHQGRGQVGKPCWLRLAPPVAAPRASPALRLPSCHA